MSSESKTPKLLVSITPKALKKIKEYQLLLMPGNEIGVRIGLKKEGVHQKKILGFDHKKFTDETFIVDDLLFFVDRRELKHFENIHLDFRDTATEKGFIFKKSNLIINN